MPRQLGLSLVQTYTKIGIDLYKPYLRAKMEKDMKEIAEGRMNRNDVLQTSI